MLKMPNIKSVTNTEKSKSPDANAVRTSRVLLSMLVCPDTKSLLIYDKKSQELISIQGKKAYPIINHMPNLTEEYCRELSADEITKWQPFKNS